MTNDELKELADVARNHWDSLTRDGGEMIADILTTIAMVSENEPTRMEGLELVSYKKVVNVEYADHWRNKAMQLAVELERVKRSALTLANTSHAISSDRLERARKLANESKPEVIDSERQANQILTEENEQLRKELAASEKQYQEACDDAHRFAAENEQLHQQLANAQKELLQSIKDRQAIELMHTKAADELSRTREMMRMVTGRDDWQRMTVDECKRIAAMGKA